MKNMSVTVVIRVDIPFSLHKIQKEKFMTETEIVLHQ